MKHHRLHLRHYFASLAVVTLLWLGAPARVQAAPAQDNDTTRADLARFDQFLDSHPEIAEQLRKNPSLVNNGKFVKNHTALQDYLRDHPGIREEVKENPNAFMSQENRFDSQTAQRSPDNDTTRAELSRFDQFLDSHPQIAEQLRKDPSLVNNNEFEKNHPALQVYLQDHPGVREEIRENPNAFMSQENRFDSQTAQRSPDNDTTRAELSRFDQFLDSHPEIAEQLRKDPSLVNNNEFEKNHPALQDYLQDHPGVHEEIRENPNSFMSQENRFDRREDARGHDTAGLRLASFREFLNGHSDIADQLSRNPSLAKNTEFVENHPEFHEYLQAHPDVQQELNDHPESFVKSAQKFNHKSGGTTTPNFGPKINK